MLTEGYSITPNPCIDIDVPGILLKIDKKFQKPHSSLYNITRGHWVVNDARVSNVKYAFAVVDGHVKDVFKVDYWEDAPFPHVGRKQFVGKRDEKLAKQYEGRNVQPCFAGGSNPVKYVNV